MILACKGCASERCGTVGEGELISGVCGHSCKGVPMGGVCGRVCVRGSAYERCARDHVLSEYGMHIDRDRL